VVNPDSQRMSGSESPTPSSVGVTVKQLRQQRGDSLDRLAVKAGVSKGALVALERGGTNPTLATLVRLADALDVSVSSLLEQTPSPRVQVANLTDAPQLWTSPAGSWARLLLTTAPPTPTEIWCWRLQPGDTYPSDPHPGGITESVSVLSGTLHLSVGNVERTLAAGTTAAYPGNLDHAYTAIGKRACQFLMSVHLIPATPTSRAHQ
jgi:transcriptional regulator with XRE-family HTH domain